MSEALGAGATVRLAVVAPGLARLPGGRDLEAALRETAPTADVPDRELRALADTQSPQGVLLVCDRTTASLSTLDPGGRFLALDGVQDPGNVGTLVRSAHAFGLSGVIVLEGCADPWGPKALRASAGSVFHIPVAYATVEGLLEWARQGGVGLKVAEAASAGLAPPSAGAGAGWTLVIGNEGAGVSESIQEAADGTVSIPMVGGTESLNAAVAGSIILYLLTREATGSGEAT